MAPIPRLVRGNCHFRAASVPFAAFVGNAHRPAVQQGRHRRHYGQTIASGQRCASLGRHSRYYHHNFQLDDESSKIPKIEKEIQASLCQHVVPLVVENTDTAQRQQSPQVVFVVGVSGGCDSVGLLHGLVRVLTPKEQDSSSSRANWGFVLLCGGGDDDDHPSATTRTIPCSIHVVHFDHQTRGAESDGDRRLVQELCDLHNLSLHMYFWNQDHPVGAKDDDDATSTTTTFSQESARTWRRTRTSALLRQLTATTSCSNHQHYNRPVGFILTAHHADDSMESLLLKLLRGTHITNIRGMEFASRDQDDNWMLRPLLGVGKQDIIDYLQARNLEWREDSSNAKSDKYLRNKIRNDLIPLLDQLVGGHEVLQRRADNLCRQSQEIQVDLQRRASRYLQDTGSDSMFSLPESGTFELVHKQALYMWVCQQSKDQHQFTYEQLERVCTQLTDFPHNQEWTMNIGSGRDIVREGKALHLVFQHVESKTESLNEQESDVQVDWQVVSTNVNMDNEMSGKIELCVASDFYANISHFLVSTVRQRNLPFTPPWRKGRSPAKAAQFLRGQKVPLHQRRETLIVYSVGKDDNVSAVALFLRTTNEWILDASATCDCNENEVKRILITLPKS